MHLLIVYFGHTVLILCTFFTQPLIADTVRHLDWAMMNCTVLAIAYQQSFLSGT